MRISVQPWMVMIGAPSETLGPDEHGHEIEEESERGCPGERELERHGVLLTLRRTGV